MARPASNQDFHINNTDIPAGFPAEIDAHVHIFPRSIFSAIWGWYDENAIEFLDLTSQAEETDIS